MPRTEDPSISDALRRFDQLAVLNEQQLEEIARHVKMLRAARGTCLLEIGSHDSRLLFLLDGVLELLAEDGARRRVRHDDPAAGGPVSRLRPSRYRVTAATEVRYLWVDQNMLDKHYPASSASSAVDDNFSSSSGVELIDSNATHGLMFDVLDDLNHHRIVVPSEAGIAIRIGRSLDTLPADTDRIASTLLICPSLTIKTLRAARAADPANAPIVNCKQAVEQLGIDGVYELAAHCVLRESLRSKSPAVQDRMQRWWRRTLRVSAISRVLAQKSERFDPGLAAMIGLLHSIAEPVMLGHVHRHSDLKDLTLLDNVLRDNRAELGRILLSYWDMPRQVTDAAGQCNNWSYSHAGDADYTDILLVSQWHAVIGSSRPPKMPSLEEMPAAKKLGMAEPSPKLSLKIVEAADSAIEQADALLAGAEQDGQ